jgi:hypothetical protein
MVAAFLPDIEHRSRAAGALRGGRALNFR